MYSKFYSYTKVLMPALLLFAGISAYGKGANTRKSKIQKLTSPDSSSQIATQLTSYSSPPQRHSLGLGLGQTFVSGDFNHTGRDKITWDLFYNYEASYSFDLLLNFHHSKQKFKKTYTQLTSLNMGIKTKFYQIDNFSPFAVGGLGFYAPKVKRYIHDDLLKESETNIVFGYHIGIGGDLKLNDKMKIGLYGSLHNPFDVKQEVGPEVEGRYYKLLITAFYSFK